MEGMCEQAVNLNHFEVGSLIGTGSYSSVFAVKRWCNGKTYALKSYNINTVTRKRMGNFVLNEKKVLNMLSHPNILKLYFTFKDKIDAHLIYEYCSRGELWQHVKGGKSLDLNTARFCMAELVNAVEYLHKMHIWHRDLKPENIFISSDGHMRIGDLATSKICKPISPALEHIDVDWRVTVDTPCTSTTVEENSENSNAVTTEENLQDFIMSDEEDARLRALRQRQYRNQDLGFNQLVGTPEYMPPEVIHNSKLQHAWGDLWALGCILYQLLVGYPPFRADSAYLTFRKVESRDLDLSLCPDPIARDLIDKLIVIDPRQRLGSHGFLEVKQHAFFDGINFEQLHLLPSPLLDLE